MFKQTTFIVVATLLAFVIELRAGKPLLANTQTNTLVNNGNGSVTDTATGLIWQRQVANVTRNHADATSFCQSLSLAGSSNWRLPNIKELTTLVDYRLESPAINDTIFSGVSSAGFWSATSLAGDPTIVWVVNFNSGFHEFSIALNSIFSRCVR